MQPTANSTLKIYLLALLIPLPSILSAAYLDHWTKFNPVGFRHHANDGIFVDSHFYLAGDNGEIVRSQDAIHWKTVYRPTNWSPVTSITHALNIFIATKQDGTILKSSNGSHWSESKLEIPAPESSTVSIRNTVYGDKGFLAFGHIQNRGNTTVPFTPIAFHSLNGSEWKRLQIADNDIFTSAVYQQGKYIIGSSNGVYTSEDIEHWDLIEIGMNGQPKFIQFSDGLFHLLETKDFHQYSYDKSAEYISSDGVTWKKTHNIEGRIFAANNSWWHTNLIETVEFSEFKRTDITIGRLSPQWEEKDKLSFVETYNYTKSYKYYRKTLPQNFTKLLYGNGIYLLIGGIQLRAEEESGLVTDTRIDPPSLDINDICVADNRIWYIGYDNWGFSENGIDWISKKWTSSDKSQGELFTANNVIFAARDKSLHVLNTKTDNDWTQASMMLHRHFNSILFFNNEYHILPSQWTSENTPKIVSSGDYIYWPPKLIDLPLDYQILQYAIKDDKLLATATGGHLYSTNDFSNWLKIDNTVQKFTSTLAYYKGEYYISRVNSARYRSTYKSSNGSDWNKIDFSTSMNPSIDNEINFYASAGEYLLGFNDPYHDHYMYISSNGKDFRRIWPINYSNRGTLWFRLIPQNLHYFSGRIWCGANNYVYISPPLELIADTSLSNGFHKSHWFGIYEGNRYPHVNHISLGALEVGIDWEVGEFYLISEKYGRFHITSPFNENQLYVTSIDFDRVIHVAKYEDNLTRNTKADFYDHQTEKWTNSIGPDISDYESLKACFDRSVTNLLNRRNLTIQFAGLRDYTAARQYYYESKLQYEACKRNAQRMKENLNIQNPSEKPVLLQYIEDNTVEAEFYYQSAKNAFEQL